MDTKHKILLDWYWRSGGAAAPPYEWFESFANSQQPLADPLTIETGQQLDIVAQTTDLSISGGYLRKAGTSGYPNNNIRSVESINAGEGRLVGFKIIPTSVAMRIGLETTTAGTYSYLFLIDNGTIKGTVRFEARDIGFTYSNGAEYTLLILLKKNKGAFWMIKDQSDNYFLVMTDTYHNYTEHKALFDFYSCTLALVDWFRVNPIEALMEDWPFDTDALSLPSALTSFTHDANGWIHLRLETRTTSGNMEIKFRIQDASNYFSLVFNTSNQTQLSVWVAGVETILMTFVQMGTFTSGQELKIFLNGSSIKIWGLELAIKADITNSNFITETDGEITSLGNGTIAYIHTMPYDITSIMEPLDV